ncbi:extracellular matrix protein fras1 [Plakobranchus ocellatus]|uniref:Extracellular matrix protein fras1 n=1 Tax=Plakobranchus ocellatus TaxID=259542 RepID=A0AAV3Y214_9GAST|nr:extracellular matrix protein fras1 [Plakobranchus ocellatus]
MSKLPENRYRQNMALHGLEPVSRQQRMRERRPCLPCRYTLEREIRQCYNYVNLSPTQLSDLALARTAAIGENPDQIYQFCLNRDALAQCIRQKALACPDSARVLAELGIQLGAFERGAEVLCRNQGGKLACERGAEVLCRNQEQGGKFTCERGAEVLCRNQGGKLACELCRKQGVKLTFERGAEVLCRNQGGKLAYEGGAEVLCRTHGGKLACEGGAEVLCRTQGVYRAGVHCFRNPIPEVRMCFQTLDTNMQQLMMIAPQPTADRNSLYRYCNIRLEHVECEQSAWARHQYQTCERAVTGMRTELECELIPKQCMSVFPNVYSSICSNMNYYYETRGRYNSAPSVLSNAWPLTALALLPALKHLLVNRL